MIRIQDWVATIPEKDKHIAYVGENSAVQRQFLLSGENWPSHRNDQFYLDMAFDLSTVTQRDSRQVVTTKKDTTENVSETQVTTATTDRKESFTVEEVTVDAPSRTDVVHLAKQVSDEGIVLTWTVLAQHTYLPGKLTATLRAVNPDGRVKKSSLMVFEVDPSVQAVPAAPITQSVYLQMMEEMGELCSRGETQRDEATAAAATAVQAAEQAEEAMQSCSADRQHTAEDAEYVCGATQTAVEAARQAVEAADITTRQAAVAEQCSTDAQWAAGQMLYLKDVVKCFDIGKNLYDPSTAHYGYNLILGGLRENPNYTSTDYIYTPPVGGTHYFAFSADGLTEDMQITVDGYDENYKMVLQYPMSTPWMFSFNDTDPHHIGCIYLRFAFPSTLTNVQIEVGDTPTAYEPYRHPRVRAVHVETEDTLSDTSTNPVQNKTVCEEISFIHTRINSAFLTVSEVSEKATQAYERANEAGRLAYEVRQTLQYEVTPRLTAVEAAVGDMDTALDGILAIQQELIGGASE